MIAAGVKKMLFPQGKEKNRSHKRPYWRPRLSGGTKLDYRKEEVSTCCLGQSLEKKIFAR